MSIDKELRTAGKPLEEPALDVQAEERLRESIGRLRDDPSEVRRVENLAAEIDRDEMDHRLGHEALQGTDFGTAEYYLRLTAERGSDEAAYWLAVLLQMRSMRLRLAGRSKKARKLAAEARKWRLQAQESGIAEALDYAYAGDDPFFGERQAGSTPVQSFSTAGSKELRRDRQQSAWRIHDDAAGRPVGKSSPARDDCFTIGIELQPYLFTVVLLDGDGGIISERAGELPDMRAEAVVHVLAAAAREIVTSTLGHEHPADKVALGVQLGGPVDTKAGTVHFFSKHPPGSSGPSEFKWEDFPFGPRLQQETGFQTIVLNDAVAFAEREQWLGVGQQTGDFVVMLIREGVGGAIVSDGKHFKGPVEIGNFRYSSASFEQSDADQWGVLEVDGGTTGVTKGACEHAKRSIPDLETAAALADEDGPGRAASTAFLEAGVAVALGLSYLVQFAGPTHVVLYAPEAMLRQESRAGRAFLGQVEKFTEAVSFKAYRDCELILRPTGVSDGAQGAALAARNLCFQVEPSPSRVNTGSLR
ncbi:MAG: ROK family protein [Streptosporangiaceae bacterium]